MHRFNAKWMLQLALAASMSASAQSSPTPLSSEQVRTLVSGKVLALRFPGAPPSDPKFFSHWDFKSDGTVCGRLIGSQPNTECADVGTWKVQDNSLCWSLQRIGTSTGINAVCGSIQMSSDGLYELRDGAGRIGTTLFSVGD